MPAPSLCQYPSGLPHSSPALRCGAYAKQRRPPSPNLPGGRERPPYNARHTGGETGNGSPPHTLRMPPLYVGADACIGPPAGLADGWRLRAGTCLWPQCRAGDFARRGGLAPPQGFRDDASIVPYGGRARSCRALQDIFAANRQCTPPSAPSGASTSPCRGGFGGTAAYKASPVRGCGVERRLRRIQRDGAGAAVAERKCASAHAARCGHRKPVMSPQATEGCGTLPCEYPSGLAPSPPAGLADGRRLCVAAHSRRLCRAGVFARRLGFAPPQGFRDDASIVPYGGRARLCRALQDIFAAKRQCTPPSAPCGASTSPCRGGFGGSCRPA